MPDAPLGRLSSRLDGITVAVFAIAAVAIAARLVLLGDRIAQYDEGWFNYWTLRYLETGAWHYRPILHGAFVPHVDRLAFALLGPSDFVARLPIALLGGLLPVGALLFRTRLADDETLALALLLAANPLLLYYSRFVRFDLPLAAFALLTVGFAVRWVDTGRPRHLYGAAVALGLAFTTKESVLLYPLAWAGALVLLLHARLALAGARGEDWRAVLRRRLAAIADGLRRWEAHLLGAMVAFLAVFVVFYAPRAGDTGGPGLYRAFTAPGMWPAVLEAATVDVVQGAIEWWIVGGAQDHPYLPYLVDYLLTLAEGAPAVAVLAVVGFLAARYEDHRPLIAFAFLWGLAFVAGYPVANRVKTPWSVVHAVVAFAVPAAVGAAWIYRRGRTALVAGDRSRAAIAAALLLVLAAVPVATAAETSYLRPHDGARSPGGGSEIVYLSQPPADVHPEFAAIGRATETDGTDVLYYGEYFDLADESVADRPPAYGGWHNRLPMPWYTELYGTEVDSIANGSLADPPPVVITTPTDRQEVAGQLGDAYVAVPFPLDQIDGRSAVIFVEERYLERERS